MRDTEYYATKVADSDAMWQCQAAIACGTTPRIRLVYITTRNSNLRWRAVPSDIVWQVYSASNVREMYGLHNS